MPDLGVSLNRLLQRADFEDLHFTSQRNGCSIFSVCERSIVCTHHLLRVPSVAIRLCHGSVVSAVEVHRWIRDGGYPYLQVTLKPGVRIGS